MKISRLFILCFLICTNCSNDEVSEPIDITLPSVLLNEISNISIENASAESQVVEDGNTSIIAKGVCWSTNVNPTIEDNKTNDGSGTGMFTSQLTSLDDNTQYFVRAYATNSKGTTYSAQRTFNTLESVTSGGVYNGSIVLRSQQEVEDFGANNYESITGYLKIQEYLSGAPKITDLSSLASLTSLGGKLQIDMNSLLENLDGLHNLNSIKGDVIIGDNGQLNSIEALSNLTKIEGFLYLLRNNTLANLNGLNNVIVVEKGLWLEHSSILNIDALSNLESVGGSLRLKDNPKLLSLDSLNKLTVIGQGLEIVRQNELLNINGLINLTSINAEIVIEGNPLIESISPLINIVSTDLTYVSITHNDKLINLEGLNGVQNIEDGLFILGNNSLENIDALNTITNITHNLAVTHNESLTNLSGLDNITSVGGNLDIGSNLYLQNIDGLQNLTSVDGNLSIMNNNVLNNFCGIQPLLATDGLRGNFNLDGNQFNPMKQDIIDGDCSQ